MNDVLDSLESFDLIDAQMIIFATSALCRDHLHGATGSRARLTYICRLVFGSGKVETARESGVASRADSSGLVRGNISLVSSRDVVYFGVISWTRESNRAAPCGYRPKT